MKKNLLVLLLLIVAQGITYAQTQQTTYDKEQAKRDYRVFLQQLKQLNAQYKEITGEIGQVIKEEGVPAWDMGEGIEPAIRDLGEGAHLKDDLKEMVLTVDLPGFKKDSIKLSFKDGKTLRINARRKLDTVDRSFERSFDLPAPGDQKNTVATYTDGVLTVKIPKTASQEVAISIR